MFTGIITDIGRVRAVSDTERARRFEVETSYDVGSMDIGASVSHAGCCLTVVEKGPDWFAVEVSQETLDRTTLDDWSEGARINLERAARLGDELGGHIVSGHVDGVGEVIAFDPAGGANRRLEVRAPRPLHRFIAEKGSITIDGVSLTVNGVTDDRVELNLIPHTLEVTTLGGLKPGSRVNLEIDMLARYLARWRETA